MGQTVLVYSKGRVGGQREEKNKPKAHTCLFGRNTQTIYSSHQAANSSGRAGRLVSIAFFGSTHKIAVDFKE